MDPSGIECVIDAQMLAEAASNNPDSTTLYPVQVSGIKELLGRIKLATSARSEINKQIVSIKEGMRRAKIDFEKLTLEKVQKLIAKQN